jgi:hypothetical protein
VNFILRSWSWRIVLMISLNGLLTTAHCTYKNLCAMEESILKGSESTLGGCSTEKEVYSLIGTDFLFTSEFKRDIDCYMFKQCLDFAGSATKIFRGVSEKANSLGMPHRMRGATRKLPKVRRCGRGCDFSRKSEGTSSQRRRNRGVNFILRSWSWRIVLMISLNGLLIQP